MGLNLTQLVSLEEEVKIQTCTEGRPCEDAVRGGHLQAEEKGLGRNQSC